MRHGGAGSVAAAAGAAAAGAAVAGAAVAAAALGGRLEAAGAGLGGRGSQHHGLDAAGGDGLHVRGHLAAACMHEDRVGSDVHIQTNTTIIVYDILVMKKRLLDRSS